MLSMELLHLPTMSPLGVYPREIRTYVHAETHTEMFVAILFRNAKAGNHPSTSTNKQINQMRSVHTMEHDSVIRRKS